MVSNPKPKRNYAASPSKPNAMDSCQTPPYAVAPLLQYLDTYRFQRHPIWEPACGQGILANALRAADFRVYESDIVIGEDFFQTDYSASSSAIVTNPPYGIKPQWVKRCYELGLPFALLMPTEFQGTVAAGEMFGKYGIEIMNIYPRVCAKMPDAGWWSTSQFPFSWYCWHILPVPLMFVRLHIPFRTVSRQVLKKDKKTGEEKLVTEWGWADWIERPTSYNWDTHQFFYKEE